MNKTFLTVLGALVVVAVIWGLTMRSSTNSEPVDSSNGTATNEIDSHLRQRTIEFGTKLKNVSLLEPKAALELTLAREYGSYLSPTLLQAWQSDPSQALGRATSSPWPERIEVLEVQKVNDTTYKVEGNVIELTNADRPMEPAAIYPVTLIYTLSGDKWLINNVIKGAYSEIPQRVSVTGRLICLPHNDTTGPQTKECASGLALDDGSGNLALNTSLMSTYPVDFPNNTRVRVEGVLVPVENLSSNMWQKYDMKGIISATSIQKIP